MITAAQPADPPAPRRRRPLALTVPLAVPLALAGLLALAACGGPAAAPAAATQHACSQIGAVLSDGPDPDADPAGYAEAQILPLRQIRISDPSLKRAVGQLDAAYQHVWSSNGASAAAVKAVAAASKQVNTICPGAAS
jgi:hypothetical protein